MLLDLTDAEQFAVLHRVGTLPDVVVGGGVNTMRWAFGRGDSAEQGTKPLQPATLKRKLENMARPLVVKSTSGWNCTAYIFLAALSMPVLWPCPQFRVGLGWVHQGRKEERVQRAGR